MEAKAITDRAEEKVRAIVADLDRPTLALLYKTLQDALGFRIETVQRPSCGDIGMLAATRCGHCWIALSPPVSAG